MPDQIGNIPVPEIVASGTFPLVPDYPYGCVIAPDVAIHQFGSGNAKIEQRFLLGNGARRFLVRRAWLTDADRVALRTFWESKYGPYGAFTYNAPNDDGNGTTPYTCRFANEPLSWEMVANHACTVGVTLVEIPSVTPEYVVNTTLQRFPSGALATALLAQVQQLIPLIAIQPLQAGHPAIYLSDRRCTVGGQLYQARLVSFDGIQQGMSAEADDASFTFGNADRVMRDLANDVDLYRASISFSLFHVGQGVKLELWKGDIINWSCDDGPEFKVSAADGLYELNLPYPCRKPSRTCSKPYNLDGRCPYASQGALDLVHFPSSDASKCDKGYDTPNGCLAHGMKHWFGGVLAEPQGVRIKDNSTGTWGFGRSPLTSVSMVADSIYDQALPEVYTDSPMPVNAKIAAGRDESDFYEALGVVCEGPVTFGSGHKLDGQYHHGHPGALGLREVVGNDPAGAVDYFSLDEAGNQTGGDWRKVCAGGSTYKDNFAAGTAFLVLRRSDPKGLQLSRPTDHQMEAVVALGLQGWVWTDSGDHQTFVRSKAVLTNPLWIAVNILLRARGVWLADAATQEQFFDVQALADATLVDGQPKGAALVCDALVTKLVGAGQESQFKFRGVMQEEKPLRDWLQEVLMNCLGFFTFSFGKLKLGVRINSSAVEAFTEGNILFRSLALAPVKPAFNHLTANFADDEYGFVGNSITVYDIDHATLVGGGTGPLFLKSNANLAGTSSKSQAGRIISVRLREELGGITPEEWKRARQLSFRTTVLALNTEPGMVCSMTHPAMPGGSGEFRVVSWRLNSDYSIDIQGRTTTDSMYNLLTGPKPADVAAEPVPTEALEPMPGDVRPFDGQPFAVTKEELPSGDVALDVVYDPPDPVRSFAGVYAIITTPDGKRHYPGDQQYNGDPAGDAVARRGSCRWILPSPGEQEEWRLAVGSLARTFRKDFVPHDAATGTPTPNRLITIDPVPVVPMAPAKKVTAITATARYGVFTELDGAQVLKVQASGTVTPDPTDSVFLCARITITSAGGQVYEMGESAPDGTWSSLWREIPSGSYTVKAYSRNQGNVELEEAFVSPNPLVIANMPASPAITAPVFEIQEQLVEGVDGSLKHQWRVVGSWAQEASDYHWYTRAQLRVLSGADPRGLVRLGEAQGDERSILTDWFDAGATSTYQLEYVANNRMEMPNAPVVAGSFTVGPLGAVGDVMAFNAGTYDEETEQWTAAMSWDPLKRFMLIDWGCLLPANRTNWSGVQIFIKNPRDGGGFDYVPATGIIGRDWFQPSGAGTMAHYDSIAIELRFVPDPPEAWEFIACSFDRGGNPTLDAQGNPTGPSIALQTLPLDERPDFTRPDDVTGLDFTTEVVGPGEVDVVVTFNRAAEPASGAQVYLERPAGTEPREAGNFDYVGEGPQTVRFRETAPAADQSWKVRVVTYSLNNAGRLRDDSPSVTKAVSAYPLAPKVASGTAEVVVADSETATNGVFSFAGTYPVPASPYFLAVEAVAVYDDDPTYEHILGQTWDGAFKTSPPWTMPPTPRGVAIRLYSINHLGVLNPDYYAITGLTVSPGGALKPEKIPDGGIKDSHLDKPNIPLAGFQGNLTIARISDLGSFNIAGFSGQLNVDRINNLGSFNVSDFTGQLNVNRIDNLGSFNINDFTGNLAVGRIANLGTFLVSDFAGNLTIDRISNLGSFNVANFSGNLPVGRIDNLGSFNIASFTGNLDVTRVANMNTVAVSSFTGSLNFDRVSNLGSFNIGNFAGVIVTQQVQDGFLSDLAKFAADLRPITKVANRPALPNAAYPVDTVVLDLSNSTLYKNAAGTWTAVSAKDTITGKLSSGDILSVEAGTIIGQINAGVITHVAVSQFAGTLSATQCAAISIHTFAGNLDVSRVANLGTIAISSFSGQLNVSRIDSLATIAISSFSGQLNVSRIDSLGTISINTFTGTLTADKITSINANNVTMVASWRDGQINDVNFSKLTVGQMNIGAGNVDINGSGSLRILGGGGITSGNIFCGGTLSVTTAINTTGAVQVIDMLNRHATFVNLTVSGLFKTAYTADTTVGWSPVGKIACYNTVGTFVGWIPIVG